MIATLEKNMEGNNLSQRYSTRIIRRDTRPVMVGDIGIGGDNPVRVQSMINEDTMDIEGSTAAIRRLHEVGCEIVRLTVPTLASAKAVGEIKKLLASTYQPVPLVADVHHNGMKIALEVAKHVDKVRINPGLFVFEKPDPNRTEFTKDEIDVIKEKIIQKFKPIVNTLKEQNKALRIGVNHGSLSERMLFAYGDTPFGMVESAMEFIRICHSLDFHNIVISMKASRAPVMLAAYRMMADTMDKEGFNYPLHLGVTEAGDGDYGRIKSTVGIGTLLSEGIGDTIRVSLSADPVEEIKIGYEILKSLNLRHRGVNIISCPSCARQAFPVIETVKILEEKLSHIREPITLSIIGCVVNGPGEAALTDIGITGGGKDSNMLYLNGIQSEKISNEKIISKVVELVESKEKEIKNNN